MRSPTTRRALTAAVVLVIALGAGCRAHVRTLEPRTPPSAYRPLVAYPLTVGIVGPEGQAVAGGLQEGLADFLINEQVFERVVFPYREGKDDADLVLELDANGAFEGGGAANFFTWFPGGLLLIPNFRGTRWTYAAQADLTVRDGQTQQPVAHYRASTRHMSIHQSSSPGPFISALLIVPAVIKGARVTSPRRPYTDMIYARAYPDLWKQLSSQIVADESRYKEIAARVNARHAQRTAAAGAPPARAPTPRTAAPARPPSYRELYSRRVAVVVGIDHYQSWPRLQGATDDARRMADYLRSSGFDPIIEIYDDQATRQRLLDVLGNELSAHVDSDSMVLVYFAGHGDTETLPGGSKRGYLVPWDGDEDVFATGVSMQTVRDLSNRMTAKHVLYAIDACYSGLSLTRGISIPPKTSGYLRKITKMRAVQILAAGSEGEQPVEIGGQGLFTTYLLRALQGEADLDHDGAVTAREIGAWVRPEVTRVSGARQTPQFGTIEGTGEVVFLTR